MIYLGLGSNLGDREQYLHQAVAKLAAHPDIKLRKLSAIYETLPFGYTDHPAFLNAVAAVETTLSPHELLSVCLGIESSLGRIRELKWGPRLIDIDILLFDDVELATEQLTLPHPYLHLRSFVLVPLRELTGSAAIYQGKSADQLLADCNQNGVTLYSTFNNGSESSENTHN